MRLQQAPCGHFAFDDTRRITAVNDEAQRSLGYEANELVGQSLSMLLPAAVRMLLQTMVYPTLAEGRPVEEVYAVLRCKNGEELPVLLNAVRGEEAGVWLTNCIFLVVKRRNVFERHLERLEAKNDAGNRARPGAVGLEDLQDARELTERMSTLGVLLAGIMHEVRNPLAYVHGNLEILGEELTQPTADWTPEQSRECVMEAQRGVARILELVDAVSLSSRAESMGPTSVDVAKVVEAAARLVHRRVVSAARLEVTGARPGALALAEESRLAQVVMNLLINAAQAVQGQSYPEPLIRVSHFGEGDRAVIEVADNGPGVPLSLRERVFKPFFTTKPVGAGTGLGLSISRQIVDSFGGALELRCPPEGGATFRVLLPLAS
jgi:PAS domain S-box-containing protein